MKRIVPIIFLSIYLPFAMGSAPENVEATGTEETLLRLVKAWQEDTISVAELIKYIRHSGLSIDAIQSNGIDSNLLKDGEKLNESLEKINEPDAVKILACSAPSMIDTNRGFAYLVDGCSKFSEDDVPLDLLKDILRRTEGTAVSTLKKAFEDYVGLSYEAYFGQILHVEVDRRNEVKALLDGHFEKVDANANSQFNPIYVTNLLLDCARSRHKHTDFERYLEEKVPLYLEDFPYDETTTFAEYFFSLNEEEFPKNLRRDLLSLIYAHNFCYITEMDESEDHQNDRVSRFIESVIKNGIDVDAIAYSETESIGDVINNPNSDDRIFQQLQNALQPYRSAPPEKEQLRTHIENALAGRSGSLAELKAFAAAHRLNVNYIFYDATTRQTCNDILQKHPEGTVILALPEIMSYQTGALDFKDAVDQTLLDASKASILESSVESYKYDVDTLLYKPGQTVAAYIEEQCDTRHRAAALKVAQAVQRYRTDKDAIARLLFKGIEKGGAPDEFITWCKTFPGLELHTVPYNPTDATAGTVGSIIDAQHQNLAQLLGRKAPTPSAPKKSGWSTKQKLGGLVVLVGAGIGYYYFHNRSVKNDAGNRSSTAV